MDNIVSKLLESKNDKENMLDTSLFDIESNSNEAYDLLEILTNKVKGVLLKFGMSDVDLDDYGLHDPGDDGSFDGSEKPKSPNRLIIYRVQLYRFLDGKMIPLARKEQETIISALKKKVLLPASDDYYDYSVGIDMERSTELIIRLRRQESI